jgi:hypothetical protein
VKSGTFSNRNPLHLIQGNLIRTPVIKARRLGIGMAGHPLGYLDAATVLQVSRNAGGPERVAANVRLNAAGARAALIIL